MPAEEQSLIKSHLFAFTPSELDLWVKESGLPRFRSAQVKEWVYDKFVAHVDGMANISRHDRAILDAGMTFLTSAVAKNQLSEDGTRKLLLGWPEGAQAETVMIPDHDRRTACVSSQVGCPVGCTFCASGLEGVKGNLTAGQIVEQVFWLNYFLKQDKDPVGRVTNIVFMGMGEPLANYQHLMKAIRILHDPAFFNIGGRRITVSTVGVPAKMRELAEEELPINLAISLHAPNEGLRKQLIPWANHFSLDEILDAARYYFEKTGREITLEYILLAGVNDQVAHARELVKVCKSMRANVNLIRYNEVAGLPFKRPGSDDVMEFQEVLRRAGVNVHVRKSRGRDIDAACGQLRRKASQEPVQLKSPGDLGG